MSALESLADSRGESLAAMVREAISSGVVAMSEADHQLFVSRLALQGKSLEHDFDLDLEDRIALGLPYC